jgi:hypothetical protein
VSLPLSFKVMVNGDQSLPSMTRQPVLAITWIEKQMGISSSPSYIALSRILSTFHDLLMTQMGHAGRTRLRSIEQRPISLLLPWNEPFRRYFREGWHNRDILAARFVPLVLRGQSVVAEISRDTIRNQPKSVFAKTDTHRQSELVALVARI